MATLLKHTVKPSGGDYTTLNDALNHLEASHANLVTADVYADIEIGGDWTGTVDTTAAVVHNLTTSATCYVNIYTDSENRASCSALDTSKYNLMTSAGNTLSINEDYVRVDGLQIGHSAAYTGNHISITGISATNNDIRLSNLLIKGGGGSTYIENALNVNDADALVSMWDCCAYNIPTTANVGENIILTVASTVNISGCVFIGGSRAIQCSGGTMNIKNTYVGGSGSEDFYGGGSGIMNKTNCASEDLSADDTTVDHETQSGCITGVALGTDTFVSIAGGSEDYHLPTDGLSPLEDAGADLSGDTAPMNFTTDIDGDTITTYPIGCDFRYVSSATNIVMNII